MSNTANDVLISRVNGNYKRVYPRDVKDYFDIDNSVLYKGSPYKKEFEIGESFVFNAILGYEQNWKYPGTADGITDYGDGTGMIMKPATVDGYRAILSTRMSEKQIARSMSKQGAFKPFMDMVMGSLLMQGVDKMEEMILWGQKPRGRATSSVNVSATSTTIGFTTGYWSAGMWWFKQGAFISFFNATTNAAVGTDANKYTIVTVDTALKTLTLTGSATDISDLDTFLAGATDANIYFYGQFDGSTSSEFAGISKFATNTGTLFGIAASSYMLWNGMNKANLGTGISFETIIKEVADFSNKRFRGTLIVLLNPIQWGALMVDEAALRRYDKSYAVTAENGFETINFHNQNGMLKIVSHPFELEGFCHIFPETALFRIGSQDLTTKHAGGTEPVIKSTENDGYRVCLYNDQAVAANTMMYFKEIGGISLP